LASSIRATSAVSAPARFQEHRVRRLCLGRAPCERLQSFARIAKPMLRVRQLVVRPRAAPDLSRSN
jgi:hypothetical protein